MTWNKGTTARADLKPRYQLKSTWRTIVEHRVPNPETGWTACALVGRSKSLESSVRITLNGECHKIPGPLSVAELLRHLDLTAEHVAADENRELVSASAN